MPINAPALISKDCVLLSLKNVCFISSALQDELDINSQSQDQSAPSENVVRLRVVLENFKPMMTSTVKELRRAGLLLDTFGLDINLPNESQPAWPEQALHKPLSCKITVLCNDIQFVLRKLNYAVYRGEVYKMTTKSQFTYQYLCNMKTFLNNLMGNEAFKDRLVQHIQRVLPILSEPESSVIPQLKVNRDLIEVQGGWFWSFSAGSFVQGILSESQVRR